MNTFFDKIGLIAKDRDLRRRILVVVGALFLFRLGANIPVPGVNTAALSQLLTGNSFLGLLNIFSGGGLTNLSIFMLGVSPYITASIIMQLFTMIFPAMKRLYSEEGEAGRAKFAQYSRVAAVPLALIQGFGLLALLKQQGVLGDLVGMPYIISLLVITGGAMLLMWIAELMTEYGIGNGMSILIFAGIVSAVPTQISQLLFTFDQSQFLLYAIFAVVGFLAMLAVVVIGEAERPITVTYSKQVRGSKVYGGGSTYLPLRLNQSGVMPIIFALSILLFPQMIAGFLATSSNSVLQTISSTITSIVSNVPVYGVLYFLLVFIFTYFYTAVTFDPDSISENLQKSGAFIAGVRPGPSTAVYLGKVISRLTLVGALFLGIIAVLPIILQATTGIATVAIGGTSLLIVVSVVLELLKQLDAQLSMREY